MSETTTLTAQCLCKRISFSISIPTSSLPLEVEICNCGPCRHITGSLFTPLAILWDKSCNDSLAKVTESLAAYKHGEYEKGEDFTRYFCGDCGSHMLLLNKPLDTWAIMTAVIKEIPNDLLKFDYHNWVEDTKDGGASDFLPVIDGKTLRRHARNHPPFTELPVGWKAASSKPDTADTLTARCHCGGVSLSISRPNETIDGYTPGSDPNIAPRYVKEGNRWRAAFCACDSCRLAAGMEVQSWIWPTPTHVKIMPNNERYRRVFGTTKEYKSSGEVQRTFCGVCGATVGYHRDSRPGVVDIGVGLLEAGSGARAEEWCQWEATVGYEEDAQRRNPVFLNSLKEGLNAVLQ